MRKESDKEEENGKSKSTSSSAIEKRVEMSSRRCGGGLSTSLHNNETVFDSYETTRGGREGEQAETARRGDGTRGDYGRYSDYGKCLDTRRGEGGGKVAPFSRRRRQKRRSCASSQKASSWGGACGRGRKNSCQ